MSWFLNSNIKESDLVSLGPKPSNQPPENFSPSVALAPNCQIGNDYRNFSLGEAEWNYYDQNPGVIDSRILDFLATSPLGLEGQQVSGLSARSSFHGAMAQDNAKHSFSAPSSPKSTGINFKDLYLSIPNNENSGTPTSQTSGLAQTPIDHPHHLTPAQKLALAGTNSSLLSSTPVSLSSSASSSPLIGSLNDGNWSPAGSSLSSPLIGSGLMNEVKSVSGKSKKEVHRKIEKNRRLQINNGLEVLKSYIPGARSKKMSKLEIIQATVRFVEQFSAQNRALAAQLENLQRENEMLKSN